MPVNPVDLAATLIGRPQAAPVYSPPAQPASPPARSPAPVAVASAQPAPPVSPAPAQVRSSTGTQEYVIPPQVAAASKQQTQGKKNRIRLAASLGAVLCGLLVLGSIVLTIVLLQSHQTDVFYTHYDALAAGEWWMTVLLVAIPVAALLLVFLPLFHWFGIIGRFGAYCLLLLVPLLGMAPVITWIASGETDPLTGLFSQGFVVPCLLFALTWVNTLWQIIRSR